MSIKVNFTANDAGFTSTVKKVNDSMDSMDKNTKSVGGSVSASFASMAKAGAALAIGFGAIKAVANAVVGTLNTFKEALDLGGELSDLSARTGESAENLLVLQRAFDNSGAGAEKVGPAINKLQKFLSDLQMGSKKNIETMNLLGLTLLDIEGKTPIEQFQLLAERISEVASPTERAGAAMAIFGRTGGEMLPLLRNFSGEIDVAKQQLGSFGGVMDRSNGVFDTISDNLTVVSNKFLEFAAGLLEKMSPALNLITTALTRIDAAAIGMKVGDVLMGASNAAKGFADAVSLIGFGEFELAFKVAFKSFVLQAADSLNSVYANFKATFAGIIDFMTAAFGPGSGIWTILDSVFEILGNKISVTIGKSIRTLLDSLPFISEETKKTVDENIAAMERNVVESTNKIKNSVVQIPGDFKLAAEAFQQAFDEAIRKGEKLVDTTGMEVDLQKLKIEVMRAQLEAAKKNVSETEALNSLLLKQPPTLRETVKRLWEAAKTSGSMKEAMKGVGMATDEVNKDLMEIKNVGDLIEAQNAAAPMKKFSEQVKEARQDLESLKDFIGGDFSRLSIPDIAKKLGIDVARKTQKELFSEIQAALKKIKDSEVKIQIDKKSTKEQIEGIISLLALEFSKDKKVGLDGKQGAENVRRDVEGNLSRPVSVTLDAYGSVEKIRDSLKDAVDISLSSSKGTSILGEVKTLVKDIKDLVAKIEPKLPTAALGA